jgi:hypothetical protein
MAPTRALDWVRIKRSVRKQQQVSTPPTFMWHWARTINTEKNNDTVLIQTAVQVSASGSCCIVVSSASAPETLPGRKELTS